MTDQPRWESPQAQAEASAASAGNRPLPLRQMGIGELIDSAIKLYRRDWLALMGIVAFVLVPVTFIQVWLTQVALGPAIETPTPSISDQQAIQLLAVTIIFVAVQFLIVQPFLVAAIARAAADAYLGERVSIGRTYRYALRKLPAILWITILTSIVTIIGFLLLIIPGIIAFVRLALGPPVLVVEDVPGTNALRRSWNLTKGNFWRLLGLLILSALIAGVGALIITIPTEVIALTIGPGGWPISALGTALATVLITPFSMLIVVLFYFDMRIRKEGFDIEVMAQELAPTS